MAAFVFDNWSLEPDQTAAVKPGRTLPASLDVLVDDYLTAKVSSLARSD
jgi:hypothetical protein